MTLMRTIVGINKVEDAGDQLSSGRCAIQRSMCSTRLQAIVHQDSRSVDRIGDHEPWIAGGCYGKRRRKVRQPHLTDRGAQLTWCWQWTLWAISELPWT